MKNDAASDWYTKKRAMIVDAFSIGTAKHHLSKTIESPTGKYSLEITPFEISKNSWDYCEARIYNNLESEYMMSVYRNYGNFPYCWLEGHKAGDFLICAEDRQSLTMIDLLTGENHTFVTQDAKKGLGFCPASFDISPEMDKICIEGCQWADAYKVIVLRIPKKPPIKFPWKELYNDYSVFRDENGDLECDSVTIGWEDNDTLLQESSILFHDGNGDSTCESMEFKLRDEGMDFDDAFHEAYNFHYKRTRTYALDIGSGERKVIEENWADQRWNTND
jgi:hypothetical protein